MHRQAFHWALYIMIGTLTSVSDVFLKETTTTVTIDPDHRLAEYLAGRINDSNSNICTFWDWVMTYHPFKDCSELPSLDHFLKATSGSSTYHIQVR